MTLQSGQLSNTDIRREMSTEIGAQNSFCIKPFIESHLKAASYDITPSIIAMSSRTGMLETVYRERKYPFHHYIIVSPKDSILVVSNDYLHIPNHIAGHVVSRVSKVTEGFGHISTSIDPGWSGAALIALSNPSNKPLKVYVGTAIKGDIPQNPLATITFNYLSSPADLDKGDKYPGMRLDLLKKNSYENRHGFRSSIQRICHPFRRRFTDFFFAYCDNHSDQLNLDHWESFIETFSGRQITNTPAVSDIPNDIKGKKQHPWEFIVQENAFSRISFWAMHHSQLIRWLLIIIFVVLLGTGVIPQEWIEVIATILTGG